MSFSPTRAAGVEAQRGSVTWTGGADARAHEGERSRRTAARGQSRHLGQPSIVTPTQYVLPDVDDKAAPFSPRLWQAPCSENFGVTAVSAWAGSPAGLPAGLQGGTERAGRHHYVYSREAEAGLS
jgi:hypothetical protein